jgi:hypothetical protein
LTINERLIPDEYGTNGGDPIIGGKEPLPISKLTTENPVDLPTHNPSTSLTNINTTDRRDNDTTTDDSYDPIPQMDHEHNLYPNHHQTHPIDITTAFQDTLQDAPPNAPSITYQSV